MSVAAPLSRKKCVEHSVTSIHIESYDSVGLYLAVLVCDSFVLNAHNKKRVSIVSK